MNAKLNLWNISGWIFGLLVFAVGMVNTFWGNDPFFGIFILLVSLVYFPPGNSFIKNVLQVSIPGVLKILLGLFVLWAALGVGELFDKIDLMLVYMADKM